MKVSQLGVPVELLEQFGAVSSQVAKAMCEGATSRSGANVGVSTTGIAGPSGGSEVKPIGTVFIGCTHNGVTNVQEFNFEGSREDIRRQSTLAAFQMTSLILQSDS
jgi:PncC family amidohydrolase